MPTSPHLAAGNWITNDLLRELSAAKITLAESKVRPSHIAALVRLTGAGLPHNAAKAVFAEMFRTGDMPEVVVQHLGLDREVDPAVLELWCCEAVAENARATADFKCGKAGAINALKGPVMRKSGGRANPDQVDSILRSLLSE